MDDRDTGPVMPEEDDADISSDNIAEPELDEEFGSVMAAIAEGARSVDAQHLPQGEVNALSWKKLESVILQMLGPYVGSESRALMSDIAQMELRLQNLRDHNQQLEKLIQRAEEEINELQDDYRALREEADQLSVETRRKIEEIDAEAEEAGDKADSLEKEVEGLEDKVPDYKQRLMELEHQRDMLSPLANLKNPSGHLEEVEAEIERLRDYTRAQMLELDAWDMDEVFLDGDPMPERARRLDQRISALSRESDEARRGTHDLETLSLDALRAYQHAGEERDSLFTVFDSGKGTLEALADMVRVQSRMRALRSQVDLLDRSIRLLEMSPEELQAEFGQARG